MRLLDRLIWVAVYLVVYHFAPPEYRAAVDARVAAQVEAERAEREALKRLKRLRRR